MADLIVGLDAEMTGNNLSKGHVICQIGVCLGNEDDTFVSDVGWLPGYTWEQQALDVNGFTHDRILSADPHNQVDRALYNWLVANGATNKNVVPVGWGVSYFDMPFVREQLPITASLISRRPIELFAICQVMAAAGCLDQEGRPIRNAKTWKKKAKAAAIAGIINPQWHDAGFDAWASLNAYAYLIERLRPVGVVCGLLDAARRA